MADPGLIGGLDLGATRGAIAVIDGSGEAQVVDIPAEGRRMALAVAVGAREISAGTSALSGDTDAARTFSAIKRHFGEAGWSRTIDGRVFRPETLAAFALKKLAAQAETALGRRIASVAVTVPTVFNEVERKASQDAALIAGLNVAGLVNESAAAAFCHAIERPGDPRRLLVFHLGAGSGDATILRIDGARVETIAVEGDRQLGGLEWDEEVVNAIAERFRSEHDADPRQDPDVLAQLRRSAETAKIALATEGTARLSCEFRGAASAIELHREGFDAITMGLLERAEVFLDSVRKRAGITWSEVDGLLMIGGMTRLPSVLEMVRRMTGLAPEPDVHPEEFVVRGAAWYNAAMQLAYPEFGGGEALAGVSAERRKLLAEAELISVNAHSLGIVGIRKKDRKTVNHVMIPRNTPIPIETTKAFGTSEADQRAVHIRVVEGESEDPDSCVEIGVCELRDLPAGHPKGSIVDVTYHYRVDGRLEITGLHRPTGREATVEIVRSTGMTDEELRKAQKLVAGIEVR